MAFPHPTAVISSGPTALEYALYSVGLLVLVIAIRMIRDILRDRAP